MTVREVLERKLEGYGGRFWIMSDLRKQTLWHTIDWYASSIGTEHERGQRKILDQAIEVALADTADAPLEVTEEMVEAVKQAYDKVWPAGPSLSEKEATIIGTAAITATMGFNDLLREAMVELRKAVDAVDPNDPFFGTTHDETASKDSESTICLYDCDFRHGLGHEAHCKVNRLRKALFAGDRLWDDAPADKASQGSTVLGGERPEQVEVAPKGWLAKNIASMTPEARKVFDEELAELFVEMEDTHPEDAPGGPWEIYQGQFSDDDGAVHTSAWWSIRDDNHLEIVEGPEGLCVTLNDYRIAGPKPWGGGKVIKSFTVANDDLERATQQEIVEAARNLLRSAVMPERHQRGLLVSLEDSDRLSRAVNFVPGESNA